MMGLIRLIAAPVRSILRSRLFQLAAVVAIIVALDRYSFDYPELQALAEGLHNLVTASVQLCSYFFRVGILTDPVLQTGLLIGYVYLICLLIFLFLRFLFTRLVDLIGWSNLFYLRNTIARERGIAAYRAWEPFERIRPTEISQQRWEETFAWPPDNRPPYPSLTVRILRALLGYVIVLAIAAVLLQLYTPFPAVTWLSNWGHAWLAPWVPSL
jgi:hypothetical protein